MRRGLDGNFDAEPRPSVRGRRGLGRSWPMLVAGMVAALVVFGVAAPVWATTSGWGPDPVFTANVGSGFQSLPVTSVAVQTDGRILAGGRFTTFNGSPAGRLVRLNADGTIDATFNANLGAGFNGDVTAVTLQPDGKILVGGNFTSIHGVTANRLVRLNADGTLDTTFTTNLGSGFSGAVSALAVQPDGKILAGGLFATLNGVTVNRLVRLNADGTRDIAFSTALGTGLNNAASALALQPDGKIVVGGAFTTVNGAAVANLARLDADGSRDTAFTASLGSGLNGGVSTAAIAPTGQILIGGNFTALNGMTANRLARLAADGTPDVAFSAATGSGANSTVLSFVVSPGKILVGGNFFSFNGAANPKGLLQLNSDGTPDTVFNAGLGSGFPNGVYAVAVQPDGNIVAGGNFSSFNGVTISRLARIVPVTVSLTAVPDQANMVGDAVSFAAAATATGGPIVYTATGLPAGLSIDSATGAITGSPTTEGTSTATVTATSSTVADQSTFTWTITPALVAPAITSGPPPTATVGTPYSFTVTATGFPAPSFTVSSGALPPGLALDGTTGVIAGTPTAGGSFPFTIAATNVSGTDTRSDTLVVQAPPLIGPDAAPDGSVGVAYTFTVAASGTPPPTFAVTAGALPPGLSLDSATGVISGRPTAGGVSVFTITATNPIGFETREYAVSMAVPPTITSGVPSAGVVGTPFAFTVTADGFPNATFSVAAGSLPPGLSLDGATGVISGTPTAAGAFSFTVAAITIGGTASADYTIVVAPAAATPAPGGADDTGGAGDTSSSTPLAGTGSSDTSSAVLVATLLILVGCLLQRMQRRRSARNS